MRICRGRLFSPRDYITDIAEWGFADVVGKGIEEQHERKAVSRHHRSPRSATSTSPKPASIAIATCSPRSPQVADVLALCGDLTNFGKTREAEILAEDLRACTIPIVGVLGNHDYECGQPEEVARILHAAGVTILGEQAVVDPGASASPG